MTESMAATGHTMLRTIRREYWFPEHPDRADDPHYIYFERARKKLKEAGKLVCQVCGATEATAEIQLHHARVEFALQEGFDWQRFEAAFPEFGATEEAFFRAVEESPENLTAYCVLHHTGDEGIHVWDGPTFEAFKWWLPDLPRPGRIIHAVRHAKP